MSDMNDLNLQASLEEGVKFFNLLVSSTNKIAETGLNLTMINQITFAPVIVIMLGTIELMKQGDNEGLSYLCSLIRSMVKKEE